MPRPDDADLAAPSRARSTRSTARSSSGSTRAPRTRRRSARSRPAASPTGPEREAQVLARLQAREPRAAVERGGRRRVPAGDVGVPRARAAAAHRLSRARRARSRTRRWPSTSASSSRPSPARRSTRCSARSRAGRPTTPWCRSRTRPRARSAARSTSCARRRCRSAARSSCASTQNLLANVGGARRGDQGLLARAVARAVRAVARAAPARRAARSRSRATPRRRGSPPPSPARRRSPARSPRRSTASRCSRRTSRTSPTTRRASGCSAGRRCRRRASDETSLVMSAPNRPGRRLRAARAARARTASVMTRLESRPARTGLWEYLFFVDLEGHATDAAGRRGAGRAAREGAVPQDAGLVSGRRLLTDDRHERDPPATARPRPSRAAPEYVRSIAPYMPGKPIAELAREFGLDRAPTSSSSRRTRTRAGPSPAVRAAIAAATDGAVALSRRQRLRAEGRAGRALRRRRRAASCSATAPTTSSSSSTQAFLQPGDARRLLAPRVRRLSAGHAGARRARHRGRRRATTATTCGDARGRSRRDTRIVFVANPNNPTGTWLAPDALRGVHRVGAAGRAGRARRGVQRVPRARRQSRQRRVARRAIPNLVVSRTFSKAYGLAALRVGYGIMHPQVADMLNRVRQPFNVNALAQAAARRGARRRRLRRREPRAQPRRACAQLEAGLRALGARLRAVARATSCWSSVGDAGRVYQRLLAAGRHRAPGRQLRRCPSTCA